MTSLVFLDTETTGLDPDRHEVWEIAYAVEDGPIKSGVVLHSLQNADPVALELGGYRERSQIRSVAEARSHAEEALLALRGATLVASNPSFDAAFLRRRWGFAPWNHRMIDISAYAMGALGHDRPKGLNVIAYELDIQAPDHSAYQDVSTLRQCFTALQDIYEGLKS